MTDDAAMLEVIRDPSWVVRRKESLELLSEQHVRHRISVDFMPPRGVDVVPLFFLRKAAGELACFDFHDEDGRSLPLPTREVNLARSRQLAIAAATDVLARARLRLTPRLRREIEFIATEQPDYAIAILRDRWPQEGLTGRRSRRRPNHRGDRRPMRFFSRAKRALWADPFFRWLIRTLAANAVVAVRVGASDRRRVLKLVYDEELQPLFRAPVDGIVANLMQRLRRATYLLGWLGYPLTTVTPHAGAQTFHLELQAPDGAEILAAGIHGEPRTWRRKRCTSVHLYLPDARRARTVTAFAQLRVRGNGFVESALLISCAIAAAVAACWLGAGVLAGRDGDEAPSLLLLFPGVIATAVVRTEHPLARRLLRFARVVLLASATTAYVAAARLATIGRATDERTLRACFGAAALVAALLAVALIATSVMPRPTRWPRDRSAGR